MLVPNLIIADFQYITGGCVLARRHDYGNGAINPNIDAPRASQLIRKPIADRIGSVTGESTVKLLTDL
jgi:hypothetical protein